MEASALRAGSEPVLPAYGGACIASLAPALLEIVSQSGTPSPEWLPEPVRHANQVVLLVVDGLGWAQLQSARDVTPTFNAGIGGPITSVAPTTTATALTSISTGLAPAEHGLVGYRLAVGVDREAPTEGRARILNVLKWRTEDGDARMGLPPREFQPVPAFEGAPATTITRGDFLATGFSAAHLNGPKMVGWQVPSTIVVETFRRLSDGERFVHAYYDGPDKVAHEHGLGEHYEAELHATDRLVGDLRRCAASRRLPRRDVRPRAGRRRAICRAAGERGTRSFVADIGRGPFQMVPRRDLVQSSDLERQPSPVTATSPGSGPSSRSSTRVGSVGRSIPMIASRLGDVALVAREPVAFLDPADTGETRLAARHGSLTAAEMYVPLLTFGPG